MLGDTGHAEVDRSSIRPHIRPNFGKPGYDAWCELYVLVAIESITRTVRILVVRARSLESSGE